MIDENILVLNTELVHVTVGNGNLELLKWLHSKQCPFENTYLHYSATSPSETLQYLHTNMGVPLVEAILYSAIDDERVDLVEWLVDNDCPLTNKCWSKASIVRNVEIVDILRQNDCPGSNTWMQKFYDLFPSWFFFSFRSRS
jgi:hypothetical protein